MGGSPCWPSQAPWQVSVGQFGFFSHHIAREILHVVPRGMVHHNLVVKGPLFPLFPAAGLEVDFDSLILLELFKAPR